MISVVIPVHNEADAIGELLNEFSAFPDVELIIAEDASTDGTPDIIRRIAARTDNVVLTSSPTLTGKGAAVKRGLALAIGDVLGFVDGDGSIQPQDFMRVAAAINAGADLAIGSRDLPASVIVRQQPLLRQVAGSVYRVVTRTLLETSVRDFQCGCKAFRRRVWTTLSLTCDGFAFDAELIAKANKRGFTIAEVPITWSDKSNSKVSVIRETLPMLRCLLKTRAAIRREIL